MNAVFLHWWQARPARERVALAIAALLIVATLGFLSIEPYIEERRRLVTELPALNADLAWMQERLHELRDLLATRNPPTKAVFSTSDVRERLTSAGLAKVDSQIDQLQPGRISVSLEAVEFTVLVDGMAALDSNGTLLINQAELRALSDRPGHVSARLEFVPAKEL